MLNQKKTLTLSILISVLALSACQPKNDAQKKESDTDQGSASEVIDQTLTLQGQTEKIALKMPDCDGNSCPEFSIDRLQTNQFVVDSIIDQAILKNLDQILDITNQSESIKSEKDKADQQATKTAENTAQQASSSAFASNVMNTPAQDLGLKVQPYLTAFLALDKELKSLGSNNKMNVLVSPRILNSTGSLVTVVLNTSSYLGGAHGSSSQIYFNFDLKHQKQVELDGIIQANQKAKLNKLAYEAYKVWVTDSKLANNVTEYEQAWKFKLSNNYYLGQQGLILQYGEYEIGPYVVGLPRLVIPYNQLTTILKSEYLPVDAQVAASGVQPEEKPQS